MNWKSLASPLLCAILAGCAAAAAQGNSRAGVCAAYSIDGSLAIARLAKSTLSVEMKANSGSGAHLSMHLSLSGSACRAFISPDNELLAISIEDTLRREAEVQVAVVNLHTGQWLKPTPFTALLAEDARGPLAGFLGSSHTLLFLSKGTYFPEENRSLLYPAFLELPEGAVHTSLVGYRGPAFTSGNGALDPRNARLWFISRGESCTWQSVILDAKSEPELGPAFNGGAKLPYRCPNFEIVVAMQDRLIGGESKDNEFVVSARNLRNDSVEKTVLTAKGREGFLFPRTAVVAPDAKYLAIAFDRFDDTLRGVSRSRTEAAVFSVEPFAMVANIVLPRETQMLALDDRNGVLALAVADRNGNVSIQKPPK